MSSVKKPLRHTFPQCASPCSVFHLFRRNHFRMSRAFSLSAPRTIFRISEDIDVPKPAPWRSSAPNTYAYESQPMVKPTGFREYDARWLLGKEINLMGVQCARHGHRHAGARDGRAAGHRHRPRFPRLFRLGEEWR